MAMTRAERAEMGALRDQLAQARAIGNAVVPQVVEVIGKAILEAERAR